MKATDLSIALQANTFLGGPASTDCSSYLKTTVTAPASYVLFFLLVFRLTAASTSTQYYSSVVSTTSTIYTTTTRSLTQVTSTTVTQAGPFATPKNIVAERSLDSEIYHARGNSQSPNDPAAHLYAEALASVGVSIAVYASACPGYTAYSSACSCIGVTPQTVTATAPPTTTTVTRVSTSAQLQTITATTITTTTATAVTTVINSQVIGATQTVSSFYLQATGGPYNGKWAELIGRDPTDAHDIDFSLQSDASVFVLDPVTQYLSSNGYYANEDEGAPYDTFFFSTPAENAANSYVYATCAVNSTNLLSCNDQTMNIFQICESYVTTGNEVISGCTPFNFLVVAV